MIHVRGRWPSTSRGTIPGTTPFDGGQARKGYALNKMCFSFNSAEARDEFRRDEEAYMRRFSLNDEQARAIRQRDVPGLLAAGGNVYYLAKLAGIIGLDVQDLGSRCPAPGAAWRSARPWARRSPAGTATRGTGTQGVELLMWLATRGAVPGAVRKVHTNYHIPISNTAAGMMAMEAI